MASGAGSVPSVAAFNPTTKGNGNGNGNGNPNGTPNKRIKTESGFAPAHIGSLAQQHFGSSSGQFGYHHADQSHPPQTSAPGPSLAFHPATEYHMPLPHVGSPHGSRGLDPVTSGNGSFYGAPSGSNVSMAGNSIDASAFLSQPLSFSAFPGSANPDRSGNTSGSSDWADFGIMPELAGVISQDGHAGKSPAGGDPFATWPEGPTSSPSIVGSTANDLWGGPSPSPAPSAPTPSSSSLRPHVPMGPSLTPSRQQEQPYHSLALAAEDSAANSIMPPHGPPRDLHIDPIPGAPPGKQRKKAQPKARKKKNKAENAASGEAGPSTVQAADTSMVSQATPQAPKAPKKKRKPKQQQQQQQQQQDEPNSTQQLQQTQVDTAVEASSSGVKIATGDEDQPQKPNDAGQGHTQDAQTGWAVATPPPTASHRLPFSTSGPPAGAAPAQTQTAQGVDALQDVMGSSGIDLRAEEHAMGLQGNQAAGDVRAAVYANSSSFLDPFTLSARVTRIAQANDLQVEGAVLQYLSLATRSRFRGLVESMVNASRHRVWSAHEREPPMWERKKFLQDGATPMYHQRVRRDPQAQLRALERVERAKEQAARQARLERDEKDAGTLDDDADTADGSGGSGTPREASKKRPLGAAAQAKNMSEDVRRRLANNTAARALGSAASTPKWMQMSAAINASTASSPLAKRSGSTGIEEKGLSADHSGTSTPGGLGALPRPRFAPQPSGILATGPPNKGSALSGAFKKEWSGLAPHAHTGRVNTSSAAEGGIKSSGWADLAERQRVKEAEEKARAQRVTMQDALHALELESPASLGRGSGKRALYKARALAYAAEHSQSAAADAAIL